MCLDFHPQHSSLLAVGLYDGTVLVYDVRNKINRPIFASTVKTGKHTDPVWQVGALRFYLCGSNTVCNALLRFQKLYSRLMSHKILVGLLVLIRQSRTVF